MQEGQRMFRRAEENGFLLMEAMRSIHDSGYEIIRKNVGKLGTILASCPEMVAELICSKITADDLPCVIEGEKESMHIGVAAEPGDLYIRYIDGRKERISSAESSRNNMKYELEDFLRAINTGDRMERFRKISESSLKLAD